MTTPPRALALLAVMPAPRVNYSRESKALSPLTELPDAFRTNSPDAFRIAVSTARYLTAGHLMYRILVTPKRTFDV